MISEIILVTYIGTYKYDRFSFFSYICNLNYFRNLIAIITPIRLRIWICNILNGHQIM